MFALSIASKLTKTIVNKNSSIAMKHKIQNIFSSWLNVFQIERKLTYDQWNVCNSVFDL